MAKTNRRSNASSRRARTTSVSNTGKLFTAKALTPEHPSPAFIRKLRAGGADSGLIAAVEGRKR